MSLRSETQYKRALSCGHPVNKNIHGVVSPQDISKNYRLLASCILRIPDKRVLNSVAAQS